MSHAVTVRPIRTDADLVEALARLDEVFHANRDTPEGDEREVLAVLVNDYERRHHLPDTPQDRPINPVEALHFHMDRLGLRGEDLVPYIGANPLVSEVLAGKHGLNLDMIARLSRGLGLPAEDFLGEAGEEVS